MSRTSEALLEQAAFERAQFEYKASGAILLALEEPEMPRCLIAERFGMTTDALHHILQTAGIVREPEFFSDYINGKREVG